MGINKTQLRKLWVHLVLTAFPNERPPCCSAYLKVAVWDY